jgi:hypothetical protein
MKVNGCPQAHKKIARDGFGCPLERANVPANVGVGSELAGDWGEGSTQEGWHFTSVADDVELVRLGSGRKPNPRLREPLGQSIVLILLDLRVDVNHRHIQDSAIS